MGLEHGKIGEFLLEDVLQAAYIGIVILFSYLHDKAEFLSCVDCCHSVYYFMHRFLQKHSQREK